MIARYFIRLFVMLIGIPVAILGAAVITAFAVGVWALSPPLAFIPGTITINGRKF